MKIEYLIDENLPPALAELFRSNGLEAKHINEFDARRPIKDHGIRRYVMNRENVVVVTRDDDFVKSYFSRKVPDRLIYVYGIETKDELMAAFRSHLNTLDQHIRSAELIELNHEGVKVHQ